LRFEERDFLRLLNILLVLKEDWRDGLKSCRGVEELEHGES
jgi:hypothetical protein